jgi:hypothetical protein
MRNMEFQIVLGSEVGLAQGEEPTGAVPVGRVVLADNDRDSVREYREGSDRPVTKRGPVVDSLFDAVSHLESCDIPLREVRLLRYARLGLDALMFEGESGIEIYPLQPSSTGLKSQAYDSIKFVNLLRPLAARRLKGIAESERIYKASFSEDAHPLKARARI